MNAQYRPMRGHGGGFGPIFCLFVPLIVAAACSDLDESGGVAFAASAGHDGDPVGPGTAPPPGVPSVVGELSCEEPRQPDAVERDLPPGTETAQPAPAGLPELFSAIRARGARPALRFDTSHAGELLAVRVAVRREQIQRADDEDDEVLVDLGALTVRLAHAPSTGAWRGPEIVVPASLPLDQAVVRKTYTRARAQGVLGRAALTKLAVIDRRDERAGPVATLAVDADQRTRALDCDALAYELAPEVPPLEVSFPRLSSCDLDECAKTKAAWLRANHDLFRIRQILDFIAASPPEERAFLWAQEGASKTGDRLMSFESDDVGPNSSLAFYFGPYAEHRFDAIRWAYAQLWRDFHDHDLDGLEFDIECTPDAVGDVCNTTEPGGHHAVKSNVKLCKKAYTTPSQAFDVPRLLLHESMHHMFVPWKDAFPRLSPIMDTHTHGHGVLCLAKVTTDKGYGVRNIKHLADYENDGGGDCFHHDFTFRNNDTFAYAAATIGTYIRFDFLHTWPIEHPLDDEDNYPAPECGQPGIDPPAPGFIETMNGCYKLGGDLVCPGSHGGLTPGSLDVAAICPEL